MPFGIFMPTARFFYFYVNEISRPSTKLNIFVIVNIAHVEGQGTRAYNVRQPQCYVYHNVNDNLNHFTLNALLSSTTMPTSKCMVI